MAAADEARAAFKRADYAAAAEGFARALELGEANEKAHLLHCNHSAALAALGQHEAALQAASRAVAEDPAFVKGHYRRALSLAALERWGEACEACAVISVSLRWRDCSWFRACPARLLVEPSGFRSAPRVGG